MRSLYLAVAAVLFLVLAGTVAAGEKTGKSRIVTQRVCATGNCGTAPTTYIERQTFYVPTTVETIYEVKSQTVVQGEPVQATVCRPFSQTRFPRLRLFGGKCCK